MDVAVVETEVGEVDVVEDEGTDELFCASREEDVGEAGLCHGLSLAVYLFDSGESGVVGFEVFADKVFVDVFLAPVGDAEGVPVFLVLLLLDGLGGRWLMCTIGGHPCL